MTTTPASSSSGAAIVRASAAGTAFFAVTAIAGALEPGASVIAAAVALGLFAIGIGVFFWAYAIAVGRSRTDAIGIGGLFFLAGDGTAPKGTKRALLTALGVQVAVGLATAASRPFTSLAFGVLVPLFGLALTGLFGARHGRFGPRRTR